MTEPHIIRDLIEHGKRKVSDAILDAAVLAGSPEASIAVAVSILRNAGATVSGIILGATGGTVPAEDDAAFDAIMTETFQAAANLKEIINEASE